jgi:hypothetical protein
VLLVRLLGALLLAGVAPAYAQPPADEVARWLRGSWLGGPGGANAGHGFLVHFDADGGLRIEHYDGPVQRQAAGDFAETITLSRNPRDYRPYFQGRYEIQDLRGQPLEAGAAGPSQFTLLIHASAPRPDSTDLIEARLLVTPAFYGDPDEPEADEQNVLDLRRLSGRAYAGNRHQPPQNLGEETLSAPYEKLRGR